MERAFLQFLIMLIAAAAVITAAAAAIVSLARSDDTGIDEDPVRGLAEVRSQVEELHAGLHYHEFVMKSLERRLSEAELRMNLELAMADEVLQRVRGYEISLVTIGLGETGSEACNSRGLECVAVTSSRAYNGRSGKFCGHIAPSCNSRVRRHKSCTARSDYKIDQVKYRSAKAGERQDVCSGKGGLCLFSPEYRSAICAGGG